MVEFAVHHESMEVGRGSWVLAVDPIGERVLLALEDGSFVWRPIAECTLLKALTPEVPRMVVVVQPQQQSGLIAPVDNRTMRRNGHL